MILELSLFLTFLRLIGTKKHFYDNNNNKNNKSSLRKRERFFLARTRNSFFCPKIEAFCQRDIPMKRSFYISLSLSLSLMPTHHIFHITFSLLSSPYLTLSQCDQIWRNVATTLATFSKSLSISYGLVFGKCRIYTVKVLIMLGKFSLL